MGILSVDFKVATEIYRLNKEEEKVSLNKLVESLSDVMSESTVSMAVKALCDWDIVEKKRRVRV